MTDPYPQSSPGHRPVRVLIAGGRFAALEAMLALREFAPEAVQVDVLSSRRWFVVTPTATGELFRAVPRARWPLGELVARAGARLVPGMLGEVDARRRRIITSEARTLEYDYAIVAVGARAEAWLDAPGITFSGPGDVPRMGRMLDELAARAGTGEPVRVAFVVPPGPGWVIPAYELALMARHYLDEHGAAAAGVLLVTSEDAPLGIFGDPATRMISDALDAAGIELHTGAITRGWADGVLEIVPDRAVAADVVIAMPVLRGPRVTGLAQTQAGFVAADRHGRVRGAPRVFVAGDAGPFPVKQGGLACQQADRVAAVICAELGITTPEIPPTPVLRGLVWSADLDRFLRRDLAGGRDESHGTASAASALWWPPGKVAGRYLAPYLEQMTAHELVDLPGRDGGAAAGTG